MTPGGKTEHMDDLGGWQGVIKMDIKKNKSGLLMVRRETREGS
jgi:hypothetical protein